MDGITSWVIQCLSVLHTEQVRRPNPFGANGFCTNYRPETGPTAGHIRSCQTAKRLPGRFSAAGFHCSIANAPLLEKCGTLGYTECITF